MSGPADRAKVTVRIAAETRAWLEREAAAERRPPSSMAALLIADALAARMEVRAMSQGAMDAHKVNVVAAEGTRQTTIVSGVTPAAAKAADIAFHSAVLTSALANSISPTVTLQALRALGVFPSVALPVVAPHAFPAELKEKADEAAPAEEPVGEDYAEDEDQDEGEEAEARAAAHAAGAASKGKGKGKR